jgi:hypothetical protein
VPFSDILELAKGAVEARQERERLKLQADKQALVQAWERHEEWKRARHQESEESKKARHQERVLTWVYAALAVLVTIALTVVLVILAAKTTQPRLASLLSTAGATCVSAVSSARLLLRLARPESQASCAPGSASKETLPGSLGA